LAGSHGLRLRGRFETRPSGPTGAWVQGLQTCRLCRCDLALSDSVSRP